MPASTRRKVTDGVTLLALAFATAMLWLRMINDKNIEGGESDAVLAGYEAFPAFMNTIFLTIKFCTLPCDPKIMSETFDKLVMPILLSTAVVSGVRATYDLGGPASPGLSGSNASQTFGSMEVVSAVLSTMAFATVARAILGSRGAGSTDEQTPLLPFRNKGQQPPGVELPSSSKEKRNNR